ncbi:MAG: helix-turn-helix transcriptional regulator [Clostridia bacterium]|nr:helix-turn-helix transcriptional regulator [Clostridia bacterium]
MEYIEIIKSIMNDCHLSQDKFARIIGVNQTTVGQWLQAKKKPNMDSIISICSHFNVSPNELLGFDKIENKKFIIM